MIYHSWQIFNTFCSKIPKASKGEDTSSLTLFFGSLGSGWMWLLLRILDAFKSSAIIPRDPKVWIFSIFLNEAPFSSMNLGPVLLENGNFS